MDAEEQVILSMCNFEIAVGGVGNYFVGKPVSKSVVEVEIKKFKNGKEASS